MQSNGTLGFSVWFPQLGTVAAGSRLDWLYKEAVEMQPLVVSKDK